MTGNGTTAAAIEFEHASLSDEVDAGVTRAWGYTENESMLELGNADGLLIASSCVLGLAFLALLWHWNAGRGSRRK